MCSTHVGLNLTNMRPGWKGLPGPANVHVYVASSSVTKKKKFCDFDYRDQCYKTFYNRKFRMLQISSGDYPWQVFPAYE
jgi:hypothetical protein